MPINSSQSEQELQKGLNQSEKQVAAAKQVLESPGKLAGNAGKIRENITRAKQISKAAGKAVKHAAGAVKEAAKAVVQLLASNPVIALFLLLILLIIIILIWLLPFGMNEKSQLHNESIEQLEETDRPSEEEAYQIGMKEVVPYTLTGIREAYDDTYEKAERKLDEYVKENFDEDDYPYIETKVLTDEPEVIAEYITPYIQSIHGSIQYYVDKPGFSFRKSVSPSDSSLIYISEENEYNTIDEAHYSEAVKEYAGENLFFISDEVYEEIRISEKEVEEKDENGDTVLDQNGNPVTYTKEVHEGTVYIGISYFIGNYKLESVEEAAENLAEELEEIGMDQESCLNALEESKKDYLQIFTGSREFNPWGGYRDGLLSMYVRNPEKPLPWFPDIFDWDSLDLIPGSIEALLALGSHDIMWDQALLDALEAAQKAGYLTMKSRTTAGLPYCTEWAHFFLYLAYGRDYNTNPGRDGGDGNGANIAYTLALRYGNEWVTSSQPTAGAIFSVTGINEGAGHVGMITKVEGNNIWYCDGNLLGSGGKTRLNHGPVSLQSFMNYYKGEGGNVYFANRR